jgi:SAM-dependent methyltransferase
MMLDSSARKHAQDQWNARACGELAGDKESVAYFDAVVADRYRQQPWMHDYFDYASFRGKRVLEIGVGQGTDLMQFANAGAECHGIDITDNHLALAQRNFTARGMTVDLHKADATAIPFPDAHFDCVYSFGVLHHIPEIELVLAEVKRVLKPGGVLAFAVYYKWSAFHLFGKLLMNGVGRGWLWSKGYAGLLATIEQGADGVDIKPYVRLYDKGAIQTLLAGFDIRDISIHQLKADHFGRVLERIARPLVPRLEHRLGWYLAAKAVKP